MVKGRAVRWVGSLLATVTLGVSLAGPARADYFEDFETYAIEEPPGDPFDDIPTGWFNDNGDFRFALIREDPNDPTNKVYLVSIQSFGSSMYGAQEFGDFDVTFRFLKNGINDDLNFLFRSPTGQTNYFHPAGYWIRIQAGSIRFSPNGDGGSLGNIPVSVPHDVWHTLRVVAEGNHFEVSYDGGLIFDVEDPDALYATGLIGFRTERQVAFIDDIDLDEGIADADGDGVPDDEDICPGGDDNVDADDDGAPDFCDACPIDPENDADGDGVCESNDNCPAVANSGQSDLDGDSVGDACDPDLDGDGVVNGTDNCPFDANSGQGDFDGDGAGDLCDTDFDGDAILDAEDACVPSPLGEAVNADGCAIAELCPCEFPLGGSKWKNHGAYVSCVAHASEDFVDAGLITEEEKDAIVSAAGESSCGHKNR